MADQVLAQVLHDLREETDVLDGLLGAAREDDWSRPTPAAEWTVGDQVTHLAYFDESATLAATDPAAFRLHVADLKASGPDISSWVAGQYRSMRPIEKHEWFREARAVLLERFTALGSKDRVPWYGPPMSALSSVTARLMETWAHGQDVAEALSVPYPQTMRLRHVAHLGVSTYRFSFLVHDRAVPTTAVRVELVAPDGSIWTWGDHGLSETITGTALDFCYVVTQRRGVRQTGLVAKGAAAGEWLQIAQAFAGPPTMWSDRASPRRPST